MGRCNVVCKDKYACFSSIVDAFITEFTDRDVYNDWLKLEYGRMAEPIEKNLKDIKDVLDLIRMNRTHDEAVECLIEANISKEESEQFVYDIETEYYCPTKNKDGNFQCPNCGTKIKENQITCENDMCLLEFIWRT